LRDWRNGVSEDENIFSSRSPAGRRRRAFDLSDDEDDRVCSAFRQEYILERGVLEVTKSS
jgi:hypothetical protein